MSMMAELKQTIKNGNVDKLIIGHAYGPKFIEFINGERRNDRRENEENERGFFSMVTEDVKFKYDDFNPRMTYHE